MGIIGAETRADVESYSQKTAIIEIKAQGWLLLILKNLTLQPSTPQILDDKVRSP